MRKISKKTHAAAGILPEELMMEILMKIPVRFLARLRCVCKSWNGLLTDPQFASQLLARTNNAQQKMILYPGSNQTYVDKYVALFALNQKPRILFETNPRAGRKRDFQLTFNFRDCFKACLVAGSINGIICLSSFYRTRTPFIALWNPSIKYWKPMHHPPRRDGDDIYKSIGLAFDSLTDDYKIIRLASLLTHSGPASRVEVYSAKQDSWSVVNSRVPFFTTAPNCSLIIKGVPYWLQKFSPIRSSYDSFQSKFIASVHPHTGLYKKISYPKIVLDEETSIHPFNMLDSLALLVYSPGDKPNQTFHVYALDDENSTSWVNIYSTTAPTILQNKFICILRCFEDAGKTIVVGWDYYQGVSFLYDLATDCLIDSIGLDAFQPIWNQSFHHVESLVCIPGMQPIPNEDE